MYHLNVSLKFARPQIDSGKSSFPKATNVVVPLGEKKLHFSAAIHGFVHCVIAYQAPEGIVNTGILSLFWFAIITTTTIFIIIEDSFGIEIFFLWWDKMGKEFEIWYGWFGD